ncbi:FGGY-family carbohydrate kinase [Maribacter sp. MMG018]|uniref:xylulokinase n=1 Tax=Maribacter sp. MMG018 TaxID=2822688 RepID=UPI001B39C631|nr:FGGY-family carbohydrate kinase [Maribacter sp. MMG018]MBQ4915840.1 FGGY-family carbohydrate kinase [Maribacter sp. MMG018]
MKKEIFLVLDIGTSSIKCGCLTSSSDILVEKKEKFPMIHSGSSFEIDVVIFFDIVKNLILQCLSEKVVQMGKVKALLITSQANTFVPVTNDFNPLRKGIVWLDERAKDEADYLKAQLPDYPKYSGFGQPLSGLFASKLLWLKKNEPDVFQKAKYFPLINEYLVYQLTYNFYADTTSFGMSGMYDFVQKDINGKLLQILELTTDNFPTIEDAAKRGVLISKEISKEWKIPYRFPVYLCGNDQCASASGAGLKDAGDITINFGSALVLFSITKNITTDLGVDQIAGKYPISDDCFLLNYEPDFGIVIRDLKEKLFKDGTYNQLFQTYIDYPEIEERTPDFLDNDLEFNTGKEAHQFCASIIKYYVNQLKQHIIGIGQKVCVNNVFLSGAITKSTVLLQIIKKEVKQTIIINNQENAGLVGALNIYLSKI